VLELRAREEITAAGSDRAALAAPTGRISREPALVAASNALTPAGPAVA
jgi:hypothetical protein